MNKKGFRKNAYKNFFLRSNCHNLGMRKLGYEGALALIRKRLGEAVIARINAYERENVARNKKKTAVKDNHTIKWVEHNLCVYEKSLKV